MPTPNIFAPGSPEGSALSNLVTALYSGDPEAKRAERQAMLENRRLDTQIKRNTIEEHQRKKDAAAAAERAQAEAIADMFRAATGGVPQGDAALAYYRAGGQQSPEAAGRPPMDDEGFAMPPEPMPRPSGFSPEVEQRLLRDLYGVGQQKTLTGKTNFEQFQKGLGAQQVAEIINDAMSGKRPMSDAYVAQGKPAFHFNAQVPVGNIATGAADATNPFAVASLAKTGSETTENLAQAEERRAAAGAQGAHARLYDTQRGAILPSQTVTGPGGVTFPVAGADISRNLAASLFPKASNQQKPPKDFRWNSAGTELEVIPGSATDLKRRDTATKEAGKKQLLDATIDAEITNIDKLIGSEDGTRREHPGLTSAVGSVDPLLPTIMPDTADAEALIESLQSKASISALQTIRSTVGAIGSLTEREWPRLESMKATLQRRQSAPQFRQSLKDYRDELRRVKRIASEEIARASESAPPVVPQGSGAAPTNARGWPLMEDAAGNKAYVGPNGEVEEVQ